MADGTNGPAPSELGLTQKDLGIVSRQPQLRQVLAHDGIVQTDEKWLGSFGVNVERIYGQFQDPKEVCRRYNELYPQYDSRISSRSLDLSLAGKIQEGQCITAMLSLGVWAEHRGMKTYYFSRNYNHMVLALSTDEIKLPADINESTFLHLKQANPDLRLFEYKQVLIPGVAGGLHEINERMLEKMYPDRKLRESPQTSAKGAMEAIQWWKGKI